MLWVARPPTNKERLLSTAATKPPSRINPARVLAPSDDETKLVNPLSTLGTALFRVCRVAASGSPTSELALRTKSGVKQPFTPSIRLPGLRICDTSIESSLPLPCPIKNLPLMTVCPPVHAFHLSVLLFFLHHT